MDFGISFITGVAAGIVVAILAIVIRYYFKRPESYIPFGLNKRTIGLVTLGAIMVASVAAAVYLAVTGKEIPSMIYSMFVLSIVFFYFLI